MTNDDTTTDRYITDTWSRRGTAAVGPYVQLDEVQWGESNYDFDITGIFRNTETGELFYAEDSGCSCPSPFEDVRESDLTKITRLQDWIDHTEARLDGEHYSYATGSGKLRDHAPTVDDVAGSISVVSRALEDQK